MKMMAMLGNVLTFGFLTYLEEKRLREESESRLREERRKTREVRAGIDRFPLRTLTREEFGTLPKGSELDLKTCPLGTWFVCAPFPPALEVIVLGHVVSPGDMICEQWGAGLSLPERGINRYRLQFS